MGGGDRFALMDFALDLGLPVEAVNSAADFFVHRIAGWKDEVTLLHAGPTAKIYRPNATLMLLLKIGRLSARDLEDCELVLASGEAFDRSRVSSALSALPPTEDADLEARRTRLSALIVG